MTTAPARPVILIVGPTAGGKSGLALALAQHLPGRGEIISADSMQVYRGMDIGTAKPTAAERALVPHHLIDVVEPDAPHSVDDWLKAAERLIDAIRARGAWPIIVGGTNLYVKAFLEGLFEGPPADESLRRELAGWSLDQLHAEVARIDPPSAARIHRNDRKRLTRAIEVHRSTGKPLSQWQSQWSTPGRRRGVLLIGLEWPVEAINPRINARVRAMIDAGLVDEVRALHASGRLGMQAREALGYKQLIAAFEGRGTIEEAIEQIKIETRRFARKQRTWLKAFRSRPDSHWIACGKIPSQDVVKEAVTHILAGTCANSAPPSA